MLPRTKFLMGGLVAAAISLALPSGTPAATTINTVAGNGTFGFAGDGGLATLAELSIPADVSPTADGGYLIADTPNQVIRKVSSSGVITTVAGNGTVGFAGDGGPATAAELRYPDGVAALPDGGFLIADTENSRIRLVLPSGKISTVAGTGTPGFSGDGGAATRARLSNPSSVNPLSDGGFVMADNKNHRVRLVSSGGIIRTVAGNGTAGYSGDGGPATSASLRHPTSAIEGPGGSILIADSSNHAIREVQTGGTIRTIAGDGTSGFGGDGTEARGARLSYPRDLALDQRGGLFVSDQGNHRVRYITAGWGTISTVAGNGVAGFFGDGGPATRAQLNLPWGVAVTRTGEVLVADSENSRIRRF
jgi:NHL repeat-containing protein